MDFVLFPNGRLSSVTEQEDIHAIEARIRASRPVLMAHHSSKPTSTNPVRSFHSSPSRLRQQESHTSREQPRTSQSESSGKAASVEEAPCSGKRRAHKSTSTEPEPNCSATQFPSPESPRWTPTKKSLSRAENRRHSNKVPPAVPEPPKSQRLPTPELSDVDEDDYFGPPQQHSYPKMDAQSELSFEDETMLRLNANHLK